MNLKYFTLMFVLLCSSKVDAQFANDKTPEKLKNHQYEIIAPQLSPDSRFVLFNKSYFHSRDTLVLIDTKRSNNVMLQVPNSHSARFTKSGHLFFCSGADAKLMQLPSGKSINWTGLISAHYNWTFNQLVMVKKDTLMISDEQGKLSRSIPAVVSSRMDNADFFYVTRDKDLYQLWYLQKDGPILLHTSSQPNLTARKIAEHSFVIYEKQDAQYAIYYRSLTAPTSVKFEHSIAKGIQTAAMPPVEVDQENIVFLSLNFFAEPKDKEAVEIWYGNDKKIDQRFFGDIENKIFIWNHVTGKTVEVQDSERSHVAYMGNPKFLLSFAPYQHKDFINQNFHYSLYRYDIALQKHEFLVESGGVIYVDPHGRHVLTLKNGLWLLVEVNSGEKKTLPVISSRMAYFSEDGNKIYFENDGSIDVYDIALGSHQMVKLPDGFRSKITNGKNTPISYGFPIYKTSFANDKDVLVHLWKKKDNSNAVAYFNGKMLQMVIPPTADYISAMVDYKSKSEFLYVRSNMNKPGQVWLKGKSEKLLYNSSDQDPKASKIKSGWVTSYNQKGVELKGVLIYPMDFDPNKKYPMVVSVYETQRFESNQYLVDGMFGSTEGINSRYLIENGYFVFLPEIVFDERGTGRSALDCVESAMEALKNYSFIDFSKVGLVGHSHGGYETNFIATQSNRFAAYIAGAGNSDLVRSYHSYNYLWNGPFYWQFESGQYRMPGDFTNHKSLYIDNSPVYHAEKVNAPVLLWTGKLDNNIDWQQTMEFYLALRRNKKSVIALFYPNDDHSLQKTENRVDLYSRNYEWFDYFLKDKKDIPWISKQMKE